MTKKEAFEHLKGTKVVLKTEDEQVKLQKFLFSIGYKWRTCGTEVMRMYDDYCMFFIDSDGCISHNEYDTAESRLFGDTHVYRLLKLEDILGLEIDEEEMKWKDVVARVRDRLGDKQIMIISKDNVMIINL